MEEVVEKLKEILGTINKNRFSYSISLTTISSLQVIEVTIQNHDNFAKMFEVLYNKHFVTENEMDELTFEKIDLTTIYLLRELMKLFYKSLFDAKIETSIVINFIYRHSTLHVVEYNEKLDTTKENIDYILALLS